VVLRQVRILLASNWRRCGDPDLLHITANLTSCTFWTSTFQTSPTRYPSGRRLRTQGLKISSQSGCDYAALLAHSYHSQLWWADILSAGPAEGEKKVLSHARRRNCFHCVKINSNARVLFMLLLVSMFIRWLHIELHKNVLCTLQEPILRSQVTTPAL
jgi:hypothetical protein